MEHGLFLLDSLLLAYRNPRLPTMTDLISDLLRLWS